MNCLIYIIFIDLNILCALIGKLSELSNLYISLLEKIDVKVVVLCCQSRRYVIVLLSVSGKLISFIEPQTSLLANSFHHSQIKILFIV